MENGEKIQIKLLTMIITVCKMENVLGGINDIYITEENISELEDLIIEMIQNEAHRIKRIFFYKIKRALVSCGTTSGDLLYINWSSQRGRGERRKYI